MTKTIIKTVATENDMLALGAELATVVAGGAIIFLHGTLGAGKTTLVRGIMRGFGYQGKVKSPTYTLVEPYEQAGKCIYHFDLYRLNHATELEHIGMSDYLGASSICLIEWPEKGFPLLPKPDMACYIEAVGQSREVRFEIYADKLVARF